MEQGDAPVNCKAYATHRQPDHACNHPLPELSQGIVRLSSVDLKLAFQVIVLQQDSVPKLGMHSSSDVSLPSHDSMLVDEFTDTHSLMHAWHMNTQSRGPDAG